MKYSKNFERDYNWYLKYKDIFTFDGSPNRLLNIDLENGYNAKHCFYILDSTGKLLSTNEPRLLSELLKCKGSINFHIKMWVEGIAEGISNINEFIEEFELLDWMIKAIENQLKKKI
jgi:hypothetical protein